MNIFKKYIYSTLLLALFCSPNKTFAVTLCIKSLEQQPTYSIEEIVENLPGSTLTSWEKSIWLRDLRKVDSTKITPAKLARYLVKSSSYYGKYGAPDSSTSILDLLLYVASGEGDIGSVRAFLEVGANANGVKKYRPLIASTAALGGGRKEFSRGSVEIARLLIEHGADPNTVIQENDINSLINMRNPKMVRLIFGHTKTNINERDRYGWLPIERILDNINFAEKRIRDNQDGVEAANVLKAYKEMKDIVIQDPRFRINAISGGGTALSFASWNNFLHLVEPLLELGADPNIPDENGVTPLLQAIKNSYRYKNPLFSLPAEKRKDEARRIAILLLEYGADPNIPDKEGNTPLSITIDKYYNDRENRDRAGETATLLFEYGGDPTVANGNVLTALPFVVKTDNKEAASRILKNPRTYLQLVPSIGRR